LSETTIETVVSAQAINKLTKLAWCAIKPHIDASPDPTALVVATFANALAIILAHAMKDDASANYSDMLHNVFRQHGLYCLVATLDE
jgi:hypothetical protein